MILKERSVHIAHQVTQANIGVGFSTWSLSESICLFEGKEDGQECNTCTD